MRTGLRKIAEMHKGEFRLTPNQNLIIANVPAGDKRNGSRRSCASTASPTTGRALRLNAMACVALPTCGLALAESERYLPDLVTALDEVVDEAGLRDDEIVIRMTGCPNGCARPYLAEIGLVGRGPGNYNLYLGAAFDGTRPEQALPPGRRPRRDRGGRCARCSRLMRPSARRASASATSSSVRAWSKAARTARTSTPKRRSGRVLPGSQRR